MRMLNNQLNVIPSNKFEDEFSKAALASRLDSLSGKRVVFRTDFSKECLPLQPLSSQESRFSNYLPQGFSATFYERVVASVDSSCALIGETEEGAIYAGRVATVLSSRGSIQKYLRTGPIIFYLDPSTVQSNLGSYLQRKVANLVVQDRSIAERFIRIQLERKAQIQASETLTDGLVVVDGALKSSVLEHGNATLRTVQDSCSQNSNQLIGVSKASSLRMISNAAAILQVYPKSQVFLDVTESVRALLPAFGSNKITVAKFSLNSPVFRVDFSKTNTEDEAQLLSDLKHNDIFFRGYPETLRLAHHLSVFDAATISSVRSYLSKQYGLIPIPSDDLRATILGKFV
jgi:hypothetical protein